MNLNLGEMEYTCCGQVVIAANQINRESKNGNDGKDSKH